MACVPTCPFSKGSYTVSSADDGSCMVLAKLLPAMQSYFHHNSFRPGQLEVMLPVMHGKDVLVKMPTGGVRRCACLCHCLLLVDTAMGLVISPLIALMEQQVRL